MKSFSPRNRLFAFLVLIGIPCMTNADEREVQRALIQRDQQSAEFARRADRQPLENLDAQQLRDAGRPLSPDPELSRQLLPYERQRMMQEREQLPPPSDAPSVKAPEKPLPLPGGPRHGVEPITPPGVGG
jgi:hypothetical protein